MSDTTSPSRARSVLVWSALALAFGAVFELTCRVEDLVRYGMPMWTPITSQSDLLMFDKDGAHGRPDSRYQKWVMNNLGMRGPNADATKPAGTIRVITVGASETFGLYESPNREFPRQLEDSLNARSRRGACAECAGLRFEVLNAAVPGMSLPTAAQDIATRLRRLNPDIIVLYPTPVQYLDNDPPLAARPDSTGLRSKFPSWRVFYPRAADRLRNQLKLMVPEAIGIVLRRRDAAQVVASHAPGWVFSAPPASRLSLYETDLRKAVGAVRAIGAVAIVATHGNTFAGGRDNDVMLSAWQRFYPRATGTTIIAFDSAARIETERVAQDSLAMLVDLAHTLTGAPANVYQDYAHFSDAGSSLVASELATAVQAVLRARKP